METPDPNAALKEMIHKAALAGANVMINTIADAVEAAADNAVGSPPDAVVGARAALRQAAKQIREIKIGDS